MIWLVMVCLLGLVYIAYRVEKIQIILAAQVAEKEATQDEAEEAAMNPGRVVSSAFLPDEWTEVPFSWKSRQEIRRPLENPNLLHNPDDFISAETIARLTSISEPLDRIAFLSSLRAHQTYFNETITAVILRDGASVVRAWGAANLETEFRDYRNYEFGQGREAPLLVDYGDEVANDSDPLVRASQWKHSGYRDLLWCQFGGEPSDDWMAKFKELAQLDRLAMMHNIGLPFGFVVALLRADTSELGITREEHARLLFSAAQNPRLIVSSRHHGREAWAFEGDANPPFEEFGQMWEACVDKWMDQQHVVFSFLKYMQTTPEVKLKTYQKLVGVPKAEYLRKAIIEGCDAFTDKAILKAAWDDPDAECKKIAREVVGKLKDFVGVK